MTAIDVCCGGRQFYFDKNDDRIEFMDKYPREAILCDGRYFEVSPNTIGDFRHIPRKSNSTALVVFDPPHLRKAGEKSYMAIKYGVLEKDWQDQIARGFQECFRILKPGGTLVFKWCEAQIPLREILACTNEKPLFGNRNPKGAGTHWIVFMKESL